MQRPCALGDPAHRGADPEREDERPEAAEPTHHQAREAVAIAEAGVAPTVEPGADVGGEHRREDAGPGPRLPAGDEEVAARRAPAGRSRGRARSAPASRRRGGRGGGSRESRVTGRSRAAGMPATPRRLRAPRARWLRPRRRRRARRRALTSASPAQRPVASAKTVSPSPMVCDGIDRPRQPVVGHQRHAVDRRPSTGARWSRRRAMVVFSPGAGGRVRLARAQQRAARRRSVAVRVAHAGDDLPGRRVDDVADRR